MDMNTSVVGKLAQDSYNQRKPALDVEQPGKECRRPGTLQRVRQAQCRRPGGEQAGGGRQRLADHHPLRAAVREYELVDPDTRRLHPLGQDAASPHRWAAFISASSCAPPWFLNDYPSSP